MTRLVVEELRTELIQDVNFKLNKNYEIYAIKIYLFANNASSIVGTFKLSVLDGSTELASKTFDITDIVAQSNIQEEYFHSWYPIFFDNPVVLQKGSYNLRLNSVGYSYSASSFIGWIREHENLKVPISYVPENDLENPLSFEVYTRQGVGVVRLVDIDDSFESETVPNISGVGFIVYPSELISNLGNISYDTENNFQFRPVEGNGGAVTTADEPFGTAGDFLDGMVITLKGESDTNTVTIPRADIQYGAVLNGPSTLFKDYTLQLQYNSSQERWIEVSRNF